MSARQWKCRRRVKGQPCGLTHARTTQKCPCGGRRPKASRPAHMAALDEPYEAWEARYGATCNLCGSSPKPGRRLQRDHLHKGDGVSLGLLCVRCNRALPAWMDAEWLERAAAYLRRGGAA